MTLKNQHCEKSYTTENNLQIQLFFIKISMILFTELDKLSPNPGGNAKGPEQLKESWTERARLEMIITLNFKLYCRAIVIKPAWHWHRK